MHQRAQPQRVLGPGSRVSSAERSAGLLPPPRGRAARCRRPEAPRRLSPARMSRDDDAVGYRVGRAGHGHGVVEVVAPSGTAQAPSGNAARCQRRPPTVIRSKLPLVGSPSARSMTVCDHRSTSVDLAGRHLGGGSPGRQPDRQRRIADRLEQRHLFGCQPRRLAHAGLNQVIHHQPGHADGQRRLVPGGGAQLPQFLEAVRRRCTWTRQALPHNMVRGAMRIAVRSGSSAGSASAILAGPLPTQPAPRRCRGWSTTPPARMCQPYAARRSPAASRCSAISAAFSSADCRDRAVRSRRPAAGAARRDRISVAIRRPPRGSAGGGRRTRRSG